MIFYWVYYYYHVSYIKYTTIIYNFSCILYVFNVSNMHYINITFIVYINHSYIWLEQVMLVICKISWKNEDSVIIDFPFPLIDFSTKFSHASNSVWVPLSLHFSWCFNLREEGGGIWRIVHCPEKPRTEAGDFELMLFV